MSRAEASGAAQKAPHTRAREEILHTLRETLHRKPLTLIVANDVCTMGLDDVLAMTSSERTRQLIRAAWYVGVRRGVDKLHEHLCTLD